MKKTVFAIVALLCFFRSNAQSSESCRIGLVEGEIGAGVVFGADELNFDDSNAGGMFQAELRYNLRRLPLDVGLQVSGTIFQRTSDNAGTLKFKTWNVMAVSDYNFKRCKQISFFTGLGVGYAALDNSAPIVFDDSQPNWGGFSAGHKTASICVMPRAGVELWHRLRLTCFYMWEEKANRHFGITFGGVFGGGCK